MPKIDTEQIDDSFPGRPQDTNAPSRSCVYPANDTFYDTRPDLT